MLKVGDNVRYNPDYVLDEYLLERYGPELFGERKLGVIVKLLEDEEYFFCVKFEGSKDTFNCFRGELDLVAPEPPDEDLWE